MIIVVQSDTQNIINTQLLSDRYQFTRVWGPVDDPINITIDAKQTSFNYESKEFDLSLINIFDFQSISLQDQLIFYSFAVAQSGSLSNAVINIDTTIDISQYSNDNIVIAPIWYNSGELNNVSIIGQINIKQGSNQNNVTVYNGTMYGSGTVGSDCQWNVNISGASVTAADGKFTYNSGLSYNNMTETNSVVSDPYSSNFQKVHKIKSFVDTSTNAFNKYYQIADIKWVEINSLLVPQTQMYYTSGQLSLFDVPSSDYALLYISDERAAAIYNQSIYVCNQNQYIQLSNLSDIKCVDSGSTSSNPCGNSLTLYQSICVSNTSITSKNIASYNNNSVYFGYCPNYPKLSVLGQCQTSWRQYNLNTHTYTTSCSTGYYKQNYECVLYCGRNYVVNTTNSNQCSIFSNRGQYYIVTYTAGRQKHLTLEPEKFGVYTSGYTNIYSPCSYSITDSITCDGNKDSISQNEWFYYEDDTDKLHWYGCYNQLYTTINLQAYQTEKYTNASGAKYQCLEETCTNQLKYIYGGYCLNCSDFESGKFMENNNCVEKCSNDYFAEPNNTCVTKCEESFYEVENNSRFCLENCEQNQYQVNYTTITSDKWRCVDNCSEVGNWKYLYTVNNTCLTTCPDGYKVVISGDICSDKCENDQYVKQSDDKTCVPCTGTWDYPYVKKTSTVSESINYCLVCSNNQYISNTSKNDSNDNMACTSCSKNGNNYVHSDKVCNTTGCSNEKKFVYDTGSQYICISDCSEKYLQFVNKNGNEYHCISDCSEGYISASIFDKQINQCSSCASFKVNKTGSYQCVDKCPDDYPFVNSSISQTQECYNSCSNKTYYVTKVNGKEETKVCINSCSSNMGKINGTPTGYTQCVTCSSGYIVGYYDGKDQVCVSESDCYYFGLLSYTSTCYGDNDKNNKNDSQCKYFYVNTVNTSRYDCVSSCPSQYPYNNSYECVSTCKPQYVVSSTNKTCISSCSVLGTSYIYFKNDTNQEKFCMTKCNVTSDVFELVSSNPELYECKSNCNSNNKYILNVTNNRKCVASCSIFYDSGYTQCMDQCKTSPKTYYYVTGNSTKYCDGCKNNQYYYSNTALQVPDNHYQCVDECPSDAQYNNYQKRYCKANCSINDGYKYLQGGTKTCVQSCLDDYILDYFNNSLCIDCNDRLTVKISKVQYCVYCNNTNQYILYFSRTASDTQKYSCKDKQDDSLNNDFNFNDTLISNANCSTYTNNSLRADQLISYVYQEDKKCVINCSDNKFINEDDKSCYTDQCPNGKGYVQEGVTKICKDCSEVTSGIYMIVNNTHHLCYNCTSNNEFVHGKECNTINCISDGTNGKFYQIVNNRKTCVKNCTNFVKFNSTLPYCVDNCEYDGYTLNATDGQRYCNSNCADDQKYIDTTSDSLHNNVGECVSQCPEDQRFVNDSSSYKCIANCTSHLYKEISSFRFECITECDLPNATISSKYDNNVKCYTCDGNTMVTNISTDINQTCINNCKYFGYYNDDPTIEICYGDENERNEDQCKFYQYFNQTIFLCSGQCEEGKYIQGNECVEQCSESYPLFNPDEKRCDTACSSNYKYYTNNSVVSKYICTNSCDIGGEFSSYYNTSYNVPYCTDTCPSEKPYWYRVNETTGECRNSPCQYTNTTQQPSRTICESGYGDNTYCPKIINYTTVNNTIQCYNSCTEDYPYDNNNICVSECTDTNRFHVDSTTYGKLCANSCGQYTQYYEENNGKLYCIDTCDNYYGNTNETVPRCVTNCTELSQLEQYEQKDCITSCSYNIPYNYKVICYSDCSKAGESIYIDYKNNQTLCINCANDTKYKFTIIGNDGDTKYCLQCNSNELLEYQGTTYNCLSQCKAGQYQYVDNDNKTQLCSDVECSGTMPEYLKLLGYKYSYNNTTKQCLLQCPTGLYNQSYYCLAQCERYYPYIQGYNCLEQCETNYYYKKEDSDYLRVCITECNSSNPYKYQEYEGKYMCVSVCPKDKPYVDVDQECKTTCAMMSYTYEDVTTIVNGSEETSIVLIKKCIDNCEYYVYQDTEIIGQETHVCTEVCPKGEKFAQNTTVSINGVDTTQYECTFNCTTGYYQYIKPDGKVIEMQVCTECTNHAETPGVNQEVQQCTDDCTKISSDLKYYYVNENGTKVCSTSCPSNYTHISTEGKCTTECDNNNYQFVNVGSIICLEECPDIILIRYENGEEKKYCVKECDGTVIIENEKRVCKPVGSDDFTWGSGNGDNGC